MKNFALIGSSGFIAPRHLRAIKETGNRLVAALDKCDSAGILDEYFPDSHFFIEFERFDRYLEKLRRQGDESRVHFVSIASPNYLHDAHIRFALRIQAHAICEKPLVINPWNIDALKILEQESNSKVFAILQLRYHPEILSLKNEIEKKGKISKFDITLTYVTARGRWYLVSWKGDQGKSGGIATNIGIHFFDMLLWIFGPVQKNIIHLMTANRAAGFLELARARVRWFLSIVDEDIPQEIRASGKRTYRSLSIGNKEVEFSGGFFDLHTRSYQAILAGHGYGLDDVKASVDLVYAIRNLHPEQEGDVHPFFLELNKKGHVQ